VVLLDPVNPAHASAPTNDSERLLYRRLLHTLIRLDCRGQPRPGLARSWAADSTGRVWTLTLKEGIRLGDGAPLTATHLVSAWQARQPGASIVLQSAVAVDERTLAVTLSEPSDSVPRVLADPAYAIAIDSTESSARLGFLDASRGDPRDALDRGADLAVTRDPALVDYAVSRSDFVTFPLPWDRTYVLLQPAGVMAIPWRLDDSTYALLARDAVKADARPAHPPYWWETLPSCAGASPVAPPRALSSRIVYPAGDPVARGIAARVVALTKGSTPLTAGALEAADFEAALRSQSERAYIVPLPRESLASCRPVDTWPADVTLEPLIETRAHAIVRRGTPPIAVDWDGTVRVETAEGSEDGS
jgi:hypothetical protein